MHQTNLLEDQPIAWTPTPDVIERAQLTKFMRQVGVSTWDELYEFSIGDVEKFTEEVLKFLDIKFDPPYEKLLDVADGIEFPQWFRSANRSGDTPVAMRAKPEQNPSAASGRGDKSVAAPSAGLNITTICLDRWVGAEWNDQPAIVWEGEDGSTQVLSYSFLADNVAITTGTLRELGIDKGDAVGIHLPMIPETILALLAINRIGAIAVPVFSGYGVEAIASRMQAVEAKALITCEGFHRRGKFIDMLSIAAEAVTKTESITRVLVTRTAISDEEHFEHVKDEQGPLRFVKFQEHLEQTIPGVIVRQFGVTHNMIDLLGADELGPEPTSAEDPLIILYTSGTTGKPKGIAHTHASFPIKAAQDMAFGMDVGRGTRICWYTDIGWMMGPWLIYGALINGGTICIYDGAPDYPTADRMWEFCAKHKVEILGISPTLVRALAAAEGGSGDTLVATGDASSSEMRSGDTLVAMRAKPEHTSSAASSSADKSSPAASGRKGWYQKGKLPHFDGEVTQFITLRLADSLPKGVLERLRIELEHDKLEDPSETFTQRVEDYLDQGAGECILKDPKVAAIVSETILNEAGKSCELKAWVVMPNHIHILLRMNAGHELGGLMKRIKGVSARKINQLLGRQGSIWQKEFFDRYIRDADHFAKAFRYIENNPVVAGLTSTPEEWKFSSSFAPASGGGDMSVAAPHERHDLSSLRAFASTGEPWNPAPWWWLFEKVGNSKLPIINYSGGTEIAGGILCGNPLLPIKPCSFPAPCPGMDVDIFDEEGKPVESGKVGELVIKQPWIGMARGFWQEKERYLDTYWRRFKDIWVHGDWAMRDEDGHWFILGRSDDTLKVAGKRVGPAEVESLLVAHPLVTEAAVIGVPDEAKGTAMVAFVVRSGDTPVAMRAKSERDLSAASGGGDMSVAARFEDELKALVAKDMGKPLAPSKIHFVSALPKTRNAKVMRRVIRAAYLGEDPGDLSALENPQAVEEIAGLTSKKA